MMTLLARAVLPLLAVGLLGFAGNGDVTSPGTFEPTNGSWVASTTVSPPETLRTATDLGTPLILSLPSTVNGQSVSRYTLLQGPSLSGVAGRSFTWIPHRADPGTHEALLQTEPPDAPPDTLVLRIELQP